MNSTQKRKILYIILRSDLGGGSHHVNQLIDKLSNSFDLYCASPIDKPFGENWQLKLGKNKFFELPHREFSIIKIFSLNRFIRQNKIELVHSHGKGAGVYSRLLKVLNSSLKVIHTFHGFHPYSNKVSNNIYIGFERIFGRFTDLFINVSYGERELCINHKIIRPNNSVIIYNGVEENSDTKLSKSELRKKLSLDSEKTIIVSVNRFDPHKNLSMILDIADRLQTNKNFLFLLIGDGEERDKLQDKARRLNLNNIYFAGFKENALEYMIASDIYISTSLGEALGYSIIESQMIGIPVIASNVLGHNEIILDGVNGLLFNLDNIEQAKTLILELSEDESKAIKLVENGRIKFEKNFTLDTMITSLKEIYSKILK